MKLSKDTANQIIYLSDKLDAESAERFPPNTPVSLSDIAVEDLQATPTELELIELIEPLSTEEKAELLALYWLGRGDFNDFEEAKAYSLEHDPTNAHIYLTEKIGLGRLIREGALNL